MIALAQANKMRLQNRRPDESFMILAGHEPFTLEIQQLIRQGYAKTDSALKLNDLD
jgi:hypothetical protein